MKFGFHHAALSAVDFDKTIEFYTKGLGFRWVRSWVGSAGKICMLDIGDGGMLEIFEGGKVTAGDQERWPHLAFRVDDVDAAYEAALKAGAASHKVPADMVLPSDPPFPARIGFVRGLNGELLEFFKEL